jgi:hypothetical protein
VRLSWKIFELTVHHTRTLGIDKLPDMDFPINEKAEGRILVPWEQNKFANLSVDSSSSLNLFHLR